MGRDQHKRAWRKGGGYLEFPAPIYGPRVPQHTYESPVPERGIFRVCHKSQAWAHLNSSHSVGERGAETRSPRQNDQLKAGKERKSPSHMGFKLLANWHLPDLEKLVSSTCKASWCWEGGGRLEASHSSQPWPCGVVGQPLRGEKDLWESRLGWLVTLMLRHDLLCRGRRKRSSIQQGLEWEERSGGLFPAGSIRFGGVK